MPSCAILNCENESKTNNSAHGGVSYHRFPKKISIKKEWIKATGRVNWRPSKSSTICSDHFDQKKIQISKKGYKFLNDKAIPIHKIITLQDQNEKKKNAKNEARPSKKLSQNKEKLEEAASVKSGSSKKRPQQVEVKEEGVPAVKPGPSKKRLHKEQEDGPAAKKARKDKDPEPNQNPPKMTTKEKLFKLLRWNIEKIRKQHLKIKSLQTVNRNLAENVGVMEEFVRLLDERITMTNEDFYNFKMTLK